MKHNTVLPAVILLVWSGCGGGREQSPTANPPAPSLTMQWKLPSGLVLERSSMDVSSDRKLAVVWGQRVIGKEAQKSCWLIDLHTAEIEDLPARFDEKDAAVVRDPKCLSFSPDGTQLLISSLDEKAAFVLDLATRKPVVISRPEAFIAAVWVGNRLLFSKWRGGTEIYDLAGELQGEPKLPGYVMASDPSGTRLLLWTISTAAVVNPQGKVLRKISDSSCMRDVPLLSRNGHWASVYATDEDGWAYSLVSTTTDEIFRLKRPWQPTLAVTDDGDSIFMTGEKNSTFGVVMTGGQPIEATTGDIVFWPRDDDPWKSTKGAPEGPTHSDLVWNSMPRGKSQIIARNAMAITLLGKELFFVQAEGDERMLKAVSLPEGHRSSPVSESGSSQKKP